MRVLLWILGVPLALAAPAEPGSRAGPPAGAAAALEAPGERTAAMTRHAGAVRADEPGAEPGGARHGQASAPAHGRAAAEREAGEELLGTAAPPWSFTRWIGPPLTLAELGGRVVLVRWWTDGCRFCEATLPELETLRRRHADHGLVVVGVYHPKPPREVSNRRIAATARRLGFHGPLAVDRDWVTLDRYWLAGHPERSWTSVSFLIDRAGRIRWVHGGGEYHRSPEPAHARCAREYAALDRALATVLAERAPASPAP